MVQKQKENKIYGVPEASGKPMFRKLLYILLEKVIISGESFVEFSRLEREQPERTLLYRCTSAVRLLTLEVRGR